MKKFKTLSSSLPVEIFREHISIHLPVKSLLRFKGVCKQWNDVINEPDFVRMHLHHTKHQNHSQKLMIYSYHLNEFFYSLDHETIRSGPDYIQAVKLRYPNPKCRLPVPVFTTMAGSVDGLVCISSVTDRDKSSTVFVWNPATRVRKILPRHPDVPVTGMHGIGFGYNSATDDYNVVRVVSGSRIDIYSLKTNSWKLVMSGEGIPGHSSRIQKLFRTCSVDGSIYWLACHMPLNYDNRNDRFIACFDLKEVDDDEKNNKEKKLIKEIPVPRDFGYMIDGSAELKVMGGYLNLFKVDLNFESLEMWTMVKINETTNDEVEYIWSRVLINKASFLMQDYFMFVLPKLRKYGLPICVSKEGKVVLRVADKTPYEFVPIDLSLMYTESLVSPNFMKKKNAKRRSKVGRKILTHYRKVQK